MNDIYFDAFLYELRKNTQQAIGLGDRFNNQALPIYEEQKPFLKRIIGSNPVESLGLVCAPCFMAINEDGQRVAKEVLSRKVTVVPDDNDLAQNWKTIFFYMWYEMETDVTKHHQRSHVIRMWVSQDVYTLPLVY